MRLISRFAVPVLYYMVFTRMRHQATGTG